MSQQKDQRTDADTLNSSKPKISNKQRRLVLGGAVGATALAWQTPVVKSIVLPAHAQTSVAMSYFAAAAAVSPITNVIPSIKSPLDLLVEPAVAQMATTSEYTVGIASVSGDTYQVDVFERQLEGESNVGEFLFSGQLTLGASGTLAIAMNPCEAEVSNITATLAAVSADSATLNLTSRGDSLMVPAGNGTVPMPMCVDTGLPVSFYVDNFPVPDSDFGFGLLDMLVPPANAGFQPLESGFRMLATKIDESSYAIAHLNLNRNVLREGTLLVNGTTGSLQFVSNACGPTQRSPSAIPATIVSVDDAEMVINLEPVEREPIDVTLPVGSGLIMPECTIAAETLTSESGLRKASSKDPSLGDKALDWLVPRAEAGDQPMPLTAVINASNNFNGSFDLVVGVAGGLNNVGFGIIFLADGISSGTVMAGGAPVALMTQEGCVYNLSATAQVISPNQLAVTLSGDINETFNLRQGDTGISVNDVCGVMVS